MPFDPHARTALAFVTLRDDGEREFMFYCNPSADMLLHEDEINAKLIKKLMQANVLHYGSISLIEEPCRSAHLAAMDITKKSEAARDGIMSIWNQSDITKISEEEITFLTGGDDPYDDYVVLKKLSHPNLKLLLVTEGAQGCRYYTKEFKGRVGGVKVEAVDTTAVGDAFIGGILNILVSYPNLYKVHLKLLLMVHLKRLLLIKIKGARRKNSWPFFLGGMLIDFVPNVGGVSLSEAPSFKKAPGGAPANVAVGIARLGGLAAFIGKAGHR
nr:putative fructokinase-7 [Quercus suber]